MKIMVVDDSIFMRQKFKNFFQKQGFEVCEAENGELAVERYPIENPDVVTMDITMPQMNGITALKKIIEIDENATVIMVTALGQQSNILEAIEFGAKDFIVKPLSEDDLIQSITKFLVKT